MAHNSLELRRRGTHMHLDSPAQQLTPSIGNRAASPVTSCETLSCLTLKYNEIKLHRSVKTFLTALLTS
jgi:hypothetical protein